MIEVLGIFAGLCTTISYFPQVYKLYKTKDTEAISLKMFIILATGLALWMVYGFMIKGLPIIIANGISFILSLYIIFMKIKYNDKNMQK